MFSGLFFFQAEDGIRDLVRSRGLGDVYKRQERYEGQSFFVRRNGVLFATPLFLVLVLIESTDLVLSLIHI